MKKKIIILSTVLVVLGVIIVSALLCFKLVDAISYSSFYDIAEDEFYIPGLMDGFVPQGFEYVPEEKVFLACGYMSNGEDASRVYVISEDGDDYYYTELTKAYVKENYTGHTGGITYYEEFVYITGSDGIDVFDFADILDRGTTSTPLLATVDTSKYDVDPAFCFIDGESLFVGNFYNGEGHENHELDVEGRDKNHAVMLSFSLLSSREKEYYIAAQPNAIYSIPDKVQGMCVIPAQYAADGTVLSTGKLVISTSYGFNASNIYIHDVKKIAESTYTNGAKEMIGVENIPLYVVDSKTLVETVEAPPMTEEIVYHNGKVWIMNKSASNKYIFGKFTTGNYLYAFEYPITNK